MDKATILIFAVGGGLAIVILKLEYASLLVRVVVPCAIMIGYAALTVLRTRFRLRYDQVGDNCYYLGFIYTLLSLGIALYLIQGNVTAGRQVADIIRDFGVALSTTLVGILLRVFLNQLREDSADIEEAVQVELFEQSQRLSGQMRAATAAMDEVRQETADKLKNFVFAMKQVVEEHEGRVIELRDATAKLAKSIESLANDFGSAEIPTGRLRGAAAETVAALESARKAIGAVDAGSRNLVTQMEATGRSMQEASKHTVALAASNEQVAMSAQAAKSGLDTMAGASHAAANRVEAAVENLEARARDMAGSFRTAGLAAEAHAKSVAKAASEVETTAAGISAAASSVVSAQGEVRESAVTDSIPPLLRGT